MNKYILTISALLLGSLGSAQVIFNPVANQTVSSPSVLLEFGTEPKGLLLPWATNTAGVTGAVNGTMVFDVSDKKVKYLKGGSAPNGWIDLSIDTNGAVSTALQDIPTDAAGAKTIIGNQTSAAPGILVLESPSKAMVLPKVANPALSIINPAAGMLVYDTTAKQVAVFNGTVWSFWKPATSTVPTITTPTGKVWMDRNLGATRVATSSSDAASFGDLYQWGRLTDGHQLRTSGITTALSNTDVPGNSNFILNGYSDPYDWRTPQNPNLWQGVNGANNPCPAGFRIPTQEEFAAEGLYLNLLKLPQGGYREAYDGNIYVYGGDGYYWTSTVEGISSGVFDIYGEGSYAGYFTIERAYGFSVRCIKN